MTNSPLRRRSAILGFGTAGAALAAVAVGLPHAARAAGDDRADRKRRDHERARQALEKGEALSLTEILTRVRPELGGEVVGVEFEREDGRWVYEFKVIEPGGRRVKLEVDAANAQVLRRRPD